MNTLVMKTTRTNTLWGIVGDVSENITYKNGEFAQVGDVVKVYECDRFIGLSYIVKKDDVYFVVGIPTSSCKVKNGKCVGSDIFIDVFRIELNKKYYNVGNGIILKDVYMAEKIVKEKTTRIVVKDKTMEFTEKEASKLMQDLANGLVKDFI